MKSYLKKFTPEDATKLLEHSSHQRPLNDRHVEYLASQMKGGFWKVNGETIILNGNKVLDGQHRLWACLEAGVPFESWVVEGVPDKSFTTINTGRVRSGADVVHIALYDTKLSAPLRRAIAAAISIVRSCGDDGRMSVKNQGGATNHDISEYVKANPDFIDDARMLNSAGRWPMPISIPIALFALLKPGYPHAFADFFSKIITDVGHAEGSAVLALRRKALTKPAAADFRTRGDMVAVCIKAWNSHTDNDRVKQLRYQSSEPFPTLRLRPGMKLVHRHRA